MPAGYFDCSPLRTGLRAAGGQMKSCGPRRMASVPASFTEQLRHIENLSPLGNYAQLLMKLVHESHETALIVFHGCLYGRCVAASRYDPGLTLAAVSARRKVR